LSKLPLFGEASDLADIVKKIQNDELPAIYTQAQAEAGTGTLGFQTSILNGLLANHPEIANDPALQKYISDGHVVIPERIRADAGSDLSDWFRDVAPRYGVNQNDWEVERDRGNKDDW
jgi:hypothetical protein